MVKNIIMLVVVGALFAGGAAASMFLNPPEDKEAETSEPTAGDAEETPAFSAPPPSVTPSVSVEGALGNEVSVTTLLSLTNSVKEREARIQERERLLDEKEKQIELMLEDLHAEREVISEMLDRANSMAARARAELTQLNQAMDQQDTQSGNDEFAGNTPAVATSGGLETANVEVVASWISEMPEEAVADVVRNMANKGDMDALVRILTELEDKNVAKILGTLNDGKLVTDIIDRMRKTKLDNPK